MADIELKKIIEQTGLIHPSRVMDFDTLYQGLEKEVADNFLSVTIHPQYKNLRLYKYNKNCSFDAHWNVFTLIARGLIIDVDAKDVVASGLVKFFNYGELKDMVDFSNEFTVLDKVDGSCGILYHYDKRWRAATPGSFVSDQAQWAEKFLYNGDIKLDQLVVGDTYVAEIIYPENKIVVPYDFSALVLLTAYFKSGYEYPPNCLDDIAGYSGFRRPQSYLFSSLKEIVDVAVGLKADREGFVIRFSNGVRIKIKGDDYIRLHRAISHVTPLAIWELLVAQDNLDMVRRDIPEELHRDFDLIVSLLLQSFRDVCSDIVTLNERTKHLSDKDLGLALSSKSIDCDGLKYNVASFLFPYRKGYLGDSGELSKGNSRRSLFEFFRPKFNKLEGYSPSSVMNRFSDDES